MVVTLLIGFTSGFVLLLSMSHLFQKLLYGNVVFGVFWFGLVIGGAFGLRRVRNRQFKEYAKGYTLPAGRSGVALRRRRGQPKSSDPEQGIPWDLSGLWCLDNRGNVLSPPNRDVEPPGFYPSPTKLDRYEFWTGCSWSRNFVLPPRADRCQPGGPSA